MTPRSIMVLISGWSKIEKKREELRNSDFSDSGSSSSRKLDLRKLSNASSEKNRVEAEIKSLGITIVEREKSPSRVVG